MGLLANILKTGNSRSFSISYVCVPLVNTLNLCDLRMRLKSSIAFIPSLFLFLRSPFWDSLASSPGWPQNCSAGPIRWLSRCKQTWRPESASMERWKERTDSTGLSFYLHRIPIAVHPASASWVLLWLDMCYHTWLYLVFFFGGKLLLFSQDALPGFPEQSDFCSVFTYAKLIYCDLF